MGQYLPRISLLNTAVMIPNIAFWSIIYKHAVTLNAQLEGHF
jgi:hypothetical protein